LRAACDGCLVRAEGEPNVMTCRLPAEEGLRLETQNVVGTRETDLLRASDWLFPHGMDHHELLAGVPIAGRVLQRGLQAFARRMAGLGRLPDPSPAHPPAEPAAERRNADVLVVGAGASGMAAALELLRRGRQVEVVDEDLTCGGGLRALQGDDALPWAPLVEAFARARAESRVVVRLRTSVLGIYGDDVLVASEGGVTLVAARTLVLAPGAHDGVLPFPGNDLPGVMSARAAGFCLSHGVTVGERVVVAVLEGGGPFGEVYGRSAAGVTVVRGTPLLARGSTRVSKVVLATPTGEQTYRCDALLVDAPRAPAYEICAQAGARLTREDRGFVVALGARAGGKLREGVFAVGEVVGTPMDPAAIALEASGLAV
jgi:sarcosine oxidase subunit alpha